MYILDSGNILKVFFATGLSSIEPVVAEEISVSAPHKYFRSIPPRVVVRHFHCFSAL